MKNFRLILLSLLIITFSLPIFIFNSEKVNASESSKVNTSIFLPTSYLQYYKLNEPFAICRYKDDIEEFVAISYYDDIDSLTNLHLKNNLNPQIKTAIKLSKELKK